MSSSVFANNNGLFHKGSGGTGKAFPDVCFSPPPAPTGPVPVPYPNSLQASDLVDGSKTVKIQGEPTALEDKSSVSTSQGDEAGNQGGNVVTHKTKGTGYFILWSHDVLIENKGVCCHDHPMAQNCGSSTPMGAADIKAKVDAAWAKAMKPDKPCSGTYRSKSTEDGPSDRPSITKPQRAAVAAGPCWQCLSPSPTGWATPPNPVSGLGGVAAANPSNRGFTPDHVPPIVAYWYAGGCHKTPEERKKDLQSPDAVQPHCSQCSNGQGGFSGYSQALRQIHEAISMAKSMGVPIPV